MRRIHARCVAAAAIAMLAATAASAQQSARNVFKGKVEAGLYDVKSDMDLSGVPGIPKEGQKRSETRQRCLTGKEIDVGIEASKDCEVKKYTDSGSTARILMTCKDGNSSDMKYTFAPGTFSSETRTTGKEMGATFVSVIRSQAKRVGPCPAAVPAQAPASPPPKK